MASLYPSLEDMQIDQMVKVIYQLIRRFFKDFKIPFDFRLKKISWVNKEPQD